jgi:hypothetical protein
MGPVRVYGDREEQDNKRYYKALDDDSIAAKSSDGNAMEKKTKLLVQR